MITEALAALYDIASRCDACGDHVATRRGEDHRRYWFICDDANCAESLMCDACPSRSLVPRDGSTPCCDLCGSVDVRRVPRSTAWRDLPHAEVLRAANAAREARR